MYERTMCTDDGWGALMKETTKKPRLSREEKAQAKRTAILEAALEAFIANGFAATRVEDIASTAHVAKGTVYLYFADKHMLFEEAVRAAVGPLFAETRKHIAGAPGPAKAAIAEVVCGVRHSLLQTRLRDVLRLLISEGLRFPHLVAFYHQEFLDPLFTVLRARLHRAAEQGELASPALCEYPHLFLSPVIFGFVWQSLFGEIEQIDASRMLALHLDALFALPDAPPEE